MSALVLISTATGKRYRVTGNSFTIGRDMKSSLQIDDPTMPRVQCTLHKVNNKWYISDQSSGGTWLNDLQLQKHRKHPICHRDVIKLSEIITFKCNLPPKEKTQTDLVVEPLTLPEINKIKYNLPPKTGNQCLSVDSCLIDEVTCSICSEMFIEAVTVKCSHSFCSCCIKQWIKKLGTCPICRVSVSKCRRSLILDNIVKMLEDTLPECEQLERQQVINTRKDNTQNS